MPPRRQGGVVAGGLFNTRTTAILGRAGMNEPIPRGYYGDVKATTSCREYCQSAEDKKPVKGPKRSPRSGSTLFGRTTQNVWQTKQRAWPTMLSCAHLHILQIDRHGNAGSLHFEGLKYKAVCSFGHRGDRKGVASG
jgi:hypothetical protein